MTSRWNYGEVAVLVKEIRQNIEGRRVDISVTHTVESRGTVINLRTPDGFLHEVWVASVQGRRLVDRPRKDILEDVVNIINTYAKGPLGVPAGQCGGGVSGLRRGEGKT
jgi:hypothetical protein